jgi:hypothetical protein
LGSVRELLDRRHKQMQSCSNSHGNKGLKKQFWGPELLDRRSKSLSVYPGTAKAHPIKNEKFFADPSKSFDTYVQREKLHSSKSY